MSAVEGHLAAGGSRASGRCRPSRPSDRSPPNGLSDTVTSAGFGGSELDAGRQSIGAALDQHVGAGGEPRRDAAGSSTTTRALAPVVGPVLQRPLGSGSPPAQGPRCRARWPLARLDGDDVRPELGQQEAGEVARGRRSDRGLGTATASGATLSASPTSRLPAGSSIEPSLSRHDPPRRSPTRLPRRRRWHRSTLRCPPGLAGWAAVVAW